jgi:DNA-binding protein Fis
MEINRRKFITSSTLTFINIGLFGNLINNFSILKKEDTEETIAQKLKKAADLRKSNPQATAGLLQRFGVSSATAADLDQAKNLYNEVIALDGEEIRAYDGLRKILLQHKHNELAVLNIFITPSAIYTNNYHLKERIAKEYMRLALGNKKFVDQINNPQDLLEVSKQLFNEAKTAMPLNVQFEAQYQKAERKIAVNASKIDARDNPELKKIKRENRQIYQHRFDKLNSSEVFTKLESLLKKPKPQSRNHHIRDTHKIFINKLFKEGNTKRALDELKSLYYFDKQDPHTLALIRNACAELKSFDLLEEIERNNDSIKNTLWSKIALFDVLLKKSDISKANFKEMDKILGQALEMSSSFTNTFEVKSRQVKLSFASQDLASGQKLLTAFAETIIGITSSHWIDRFNNLCAKYYKDNNEKQKAVMVYNIALQENDMPLNDLLLQKVHLVNTYRKKNMVIHNNSLRYFRDLLAN